MIRHDNIFIKTYPLIFFTDLQKSGFYHQTDLRRTRNARPYIDCT